MKSIKYPAPGKLVAVDGHKMHVFTAGNGKDMLVFMAGSGTACPTLDFKPLWSLLLNDFQIAVVEKSGYGWSEPTDNARDIGTMLSESRAALKLAGAEPPYILVPHSMSGLEAIYWAQTYPDEVKAIVGLDAVAPEAYDKFKAPSAALIDAIRFLAGIGIHRPFAKLLYKNSPAALSGSLSQADSEIYIEMLKRRTFTSDMCNEGKLLLENSKSVKNGAIPGDIPLILFISNENEKIIKNFSQIMRDYASHFTNGKSIDLNCGHYVHAFEPAKIANEIKDFILKLSDT